MLPVTRTLEFPTGLMMERVLTVVASAAAMVKAANLPGNTLLNRK